MSGKAYGKVIHRFGNDNLFPERLAKSAPNAAKTGG
jgi:hypothetical protein